jgi:tetratricopeptide (TPR) repeat protein
MAVDQWSAVRAKLAISGCAPGVFMVRKIIYTITAVIISALLVESAGRIVENFRRTVPVDARSRLSFQQLPAVSMVAEVPAADGPRYLIRNVDWVGQTVPVKKTNAEYRIVLLGESAAAGMGVAPPATFAGILERLLSQVSNGRRVRVLNLARTGYASPQLAWILDKSIDALAPDLVLTVMGNNEYLDSRAVFACNDDESAKLEKARLWERRSAFLRLLRPRVREDPSLPETLPENIVKTPGGALCANTNGRLAESIRSIARSCARVKSRLMLSTVAVNHKFETQREWFFIGKEERDGREFQKARWAMRYGAFEEAASLMRKRLSAQPGEYASRLILGMALKAMGEREAASQEFGALEKDLSRFNASKTDFLMIALEAWTLRELSGAEAVSANIDLWVSRLSLDERNAELSAIIGTLYSLAGRETEARATFTKILDNQCFIADKEINRTIMAVGREVGAETSDLASVAENASPQKIPGWEWFLDYCHYNVRGHILAGHLLAGKIAAFAGFKGVVPEVEIALAQEAAQRRNLPFDVPDLDLWAGADFDPARLTEGAIDQGRRPIEELEERIRKNGDSALARTYLGNWKIYEIDDDPLHAEAVKEYERALVLDPDFSPAKANLKVVAEMNRR